MTTDLWILVASAMLVPALTLPIAAARGQVPKGNAWGFGNRDTPLEGTPAWGDRAVRAHMNLVENLPTYAVLVLIAHAIGATYATTAIGGGIFLGARVLHAAVYIAGVPYIRTAAFGLCQLGNLIYLWQIAVHGGAGY